MSTTLDIVTEQVTELAKKSSQPFWLKTPFCKQRVEKKQDNPCTNCESKLMCSFALHMYKTTEVMLEMQDALNYQQKHINQQNETIHQLQEMLHAKS